MKKLALIVSFLLSISSILIGQLSPLLNCKVIDYESKKPLRAIVTSASGEEFTIANTEGQLEFRRTFAIDTIWLIDALGYEPYIGKMDSVIELKAYQKKVESGIIPGKDLVKSAMRQLENNYGSVNQVLYGFFNETIYERNDLISFSEGIVQSFKGPYRNNFGFDQCFQALENESSILIKGNRRSTFSTESTFAATEQGYLLPKTLDPLSICSSPLIAENIEHFTFTYEYSLAEQPETIYSIAFKNTNSGIYGKIYIGKKSLGIYRLEVDEIKSIPTLESEFSEIASNYTVDYKNNQDLFFLGNISHTQLIQNTESQDTIHIESNYVTTRMPIKLDSLPGRRKVLSRNASTEPFLSIYPHKRFSTTQLIPRTEFVQNNIGEGEKIIFNEGNLQEVIQKSQQDRNLIFLYVYAENDVPSKEMEERTFQDQEIVSYLNRNFTCSEFSLEEAEDNGILYMAELEFLPSFIIMTPLGQIIQIFDGFILPVNLIGILKSYEGFDVNKLFYAYDKRKGSDGKKIKAAYLDLFRQLRDLNHPMAPEFVRFFEDETKNWESLEAKNAIFEYLIPSKEKKYNKIFLSNIAYYERTFGKDEVATKLYSYAYQRVLDKGIKDYKEFEKYLNKNAPQYTDSLYAYFLVEYFSTLRIEKPSYIAAVLEYLDKYHENNWAIASRHLMTVGVNTDNIAVIRRCMDILKKYEGKVTEYEYLDIYSLFLYKSGKEQEALEMITEILSLAEKSGVNYEVALRMLANKKSN